MTEVQQEADTEREGVRPTVADEVTDPSMAPITDDGSGQIEEDDDDRAKSEDEVAAQLGDFA